MNDLVADWRGLAVDIRAAGVDIFNTGDIQRSAKGFADEKYLAMTLLVRTVSNMTGAISLLDAKRIVEARIITRSVFENLYWVVGLVEQGEAFVRQMRDDEMSHRRMRGQEIFAAEVNLEEDVSNRLRTYLKGVNKQFGGAKTLTPKQVAQIRPDFEKTYLFYGHLSSDAAHPSVTALNRYVVPESHPGGGGIDIEPVVSAEEMAETYEYLCMTAMGVFVAANQIIGGTSGGGALNGIADRYTSLSNATKAEEKKL
jgi:Family of unknown function (DUF5677)